MVFLSAVSEFASDCVLSYEEVENEHTVVFYLFISQVFILLICDNLKCCFFRFSIRKSLKF